MSEIDPLVSLLQKNPRLTCITGAGISAPSGVPTFRGEHGLWKNFRPEDLATPEAFARNPRLVWEWYNWRRELVGRAAPNAGHLALAEMEGFVQNLTVITQNVDGLHARAGSSSIIELHGNIARTICSQEGRVIRDWEVSVEQSNEW